MAAPSERQFSAAASTSIAVAYGVASAVTTLANKALLSSWSFGFVFTLLFAQNALTIACIALAQFLTRQPSGRKVTTGSWADELNFPLFDLGFSHCMIPVMLGNVANLWCGLNALRLSSVPVYQTLKRLAPLPALILDFVLRGKRASLPVVCSILVVCAGAIILGLGDLDRNAHGYLFAIGSCVLQTLYLVLAAKAADTRAMSPLCVVHYNSLLSMPLLLVGISYESEALRAFASWSDARFLVMLALDLALGACLSLFMFACALINSAVTTVLVGNAKAIA